MNLVIGSYFIYCNLSTINKYKKTLNYKSPIRVRLIKNHFSFNDVLTNTTNAIFYIFLKYDKKYNYWHSRYY